MDEQGLGASSAGEGDPGPPSPEPEAPAEPTSEGLTSEPEAPAEEESAPASAETLTLVPELEMQDPAVLGPGVESISGETVQDLIGAIDNLNETIVGATPTEEQSAEEETVTDPGAESPADAVSVEENPDPAADPVVQLLEQHTALLKQTSETLIQQTDILQQQHNDLLQVQTNLDIIFLGLGMLAGVLLGCSVGRVFHDLWRA